MDVLTPISEIEFMSPRIIRILGCNPGPIARQGSNMYLIGTGTRRVLIDAGERNRPKYLTNLKQVLTQNNVSELIIIVTHWHVDHNSGVDDLCHKVLNLSPGQKQEVLKFPRKNGPEEDIGDLAEYKYIEDGHVVKVEGATLRILYTPGHTDDHLSVYLEEENAVFLGDCMLGDTYSCVFENYADLIVSMNRLLDLKPSIVYSGHGPVISDPFNQINCFLQHRKNREDQVINALKANSNVPMTIRQIVDTIYGTLPSVEQVWLAERNILHHLQKLVGEKRADTKHKDDSKVWFLTTVE